MLMNHLPGDMASMGQSVFSEMPMNGIGFGLLAVCATFILQRCSVGHDALRRCTQHVLLRNALLDSLLTMRSRVAPEAASVEALRLSLTRAGLLTCSSGLCARWV